MIILYTALMIPGILVMIVSCPYRDPIQNIGTIITELLFFLMLFELSIHSLFPNTLGIESISNILYYEIIITLIFTIIWTSISSILWIGLVVI